MKYKRGDIVLYKTGNRSLYVGGKWVIPTADGGEPAAVITYGIDPDGWYWWALGKMGKAPSYEQARAAAEEVIRGAI